MYQLVIFLQDILRCQRHNTVVSTDDTTVKALQCANSKVRIDLLTDVNK